jgi:hypothetical protein
MENYWGGGAKAPQPLPPCSPVPDITLAIDVIGFN